MAPNLFRYEKRAERMLPGAHFARRVLAHFAVAAAIAAVSLLAGMAGYVYFEDLSWTDAFLNSAMLLGGMGPVDNPVTEGGKIFAGCYALFAGVIFLIVAGVIVAPVAHRLLHRFHWDEREK